MTRLAGLIILACLLAYPQTSFDVASDFSLEKNPNSVWQYGYSATRSLDPAEFRLDTQTEIVDATGFWHPTENKGPGPGYYPYIAYNRTKQTQFGSRKGWAVRAGQVAMEASNSGQYSLIRFVAPRRGTYRITARFEGIHFGLSSTDVHVLHNASPLFAANIEGYGGDPNFHKVEGSNPAAEYSGQILLQKNETVTFACGYGSNKTHFGDTTGLQARIVLLPETGADK
jgi:hypothetical protein